MYNASMKTLVPEHLPAATRTFLESILERVNCTEEDIKDRGTRVLIHPDMIPAEMSQDVSDQFWLFISENVNQGYVVYLEKKDLWTD